MELIPSRDVTQDYETDSDGFEVEEARSADRVPRAHQYGSAPELAWHESMSRRRDSRAWRGGSWRPRRRTGRKGRRTGEARV